MEREERFFENTSAQVKFNCGQVDIEIVGAKDVRLFKERYTVPEDTKFNRALCIQFVTDKIKEAYDSLYESNSLKPLLKDGRFAIDDEGEKMIIRDEHIFYENGAIYRFSEIGDDLYLPCVRRWIVFIGESYTYCDFNMIEKGIYDCVWQRCDGKAET